jgi:hypothetical protein
MSTTRPGRARRIPFHKLVSIPARVGYILLWLVERPARVLLPAAALIALALVFQQLPDFLQILASIVLVWIGVDIGQQMRGQDTPPAPPREGVN